MKNILKRISSLALALTLVMALALPAAAATASVTFNSKKSISFAPGSGYTATDLFPDFKNVMPGDTLYQTVTITNKVKDASYLKVYMKAVPHSQVNNPLTYSEVFENTDGKDQANVAGERDETEASANDFLSQLYMTVYNKNAKKTIYEDSPDQPDGLTKFVYLGNLNYGKSLELEVELTVPITMGNEYAYRVGEVDWVFYAEAVQDDTLIQTGQLNWPIPVLGTLGVGLVIFGFFFLRRKKKEENV